MRQHVRDHVTAMWFLCCSYCSKASISDVNFSRDANTKHFRQTLKTQTHDQFSEVANPNHKKKVVRTYLHFLQPTRLFVVRASRRLKLLLMRLLGNELSRETMDPQVPELNRRAQKQSVIIEFITNH